MIFTKSNFVKVVKFPHPPTPAGSAGGGGRVGKRDYLINKNIKIQQPIIIL